MAVTGPPLRTSVAARTADESANAAMSVAVPATRTLRDAFRANMTHLLLPRSAAFGGQRTPRLHPRAQHRERAADNLEAHVFVELDTPLNVDRVLAGADRTAHELHAVGLQNVGAGQAEIDLASRTDRLAVDPGADEAEVAV